MVGFKAIPERSAWDAVRNTVGRRAFNAGWCTPSQRRVTAGHTKPDTSPPHAGPWVVFGAPKIQT